jgi:hypothetical protein
VCQVFQAWPRGLWTPPHTDPKRFTSPTVYTSWASWHPPACSLQPGRVLKPRSKLSTGGRPSPAPSPLVAIAPSAWEPRVLFGSQRRCPQPSHHPSQTLGRALGQVLKGFISIGDELTILASEKCREWLIFQRQENIREPKKVLWVPTLG